MVPTYLRTTIAMIAILVAGVPVAAASTDPGGVDDMQAESGRLWYDKYCTPCHGPGGAPGSAARPDGTTVDLRSYVERHGGRFPAEQWIRVVEDVDLRSPHADVWQKIRRAQLGTLTEKAAARGILLLIAEYVLSVQTN